MAEYEFQELETLKADIAKLRSDLIDLAQKLTDLGKDGVGTTKEELESKAQNLKERGLFNRCVKIIQAASLCLSIFSSTITPSTNLFPE